MYVRMYSCRKFALGNKSTLQDLLCQRDESFQFSRFPGFFVPASGGSLQELSSFKVIDQCLASSSLMERSRHSEFGCQFSGWRRFLASCLVWVRGRQTYKLFVVCHLLFCAYHLHSSCLLDLLLLRPGNYHPCIMLSLCLYHVCSVTRRRRQSSWVHFLVGFAVC